MVDEFEKDHDIFDKTQFLKDLLDETEEGYLPKELYNRKNGFQGEKTEEREKTSKRLIYEKIQRKAQRDIQQQEKYEKNNTEKFRKERELITSGTMVTQESGDQDFRPRKIKNQLVDEIDGNKNDDQKVQQLQSRFQKYSESEIYKNSPNNPINMKGSIVAYLANDVFQPHYEELDKSKKRNDEQQKRIENQKSIKQSVYNQQQQNSSTNMSSDSLLLSSNGMGQNQQRQNDNGFNSNISSLTASTAMYTNASKTSYSQQYVSQFLNPNLCNYIKDADQNLVDIKDEDISLDDGAKKKKYRLKKKKNPNDTLNSQSEFDSPDQMRKTQNHSSTSEIHEEDAKRNAAIRIKEKNQDVLSKLQITRIQENPSEDVKDTDLFQYSYENSQEEEDMEEEDDKQKRLKKFQEKVPMPKNFAHAQDGILFQKFRDWMGDTEPSKAKQLNDLFKLFKVNKKSFQISQKSDIPVYDQHRWFIFYQTVLYKQVEKKTKEIAQDYDYENNVIPKSLVQYNQKKSWSNFTNKQIF